MASQTKKKRQTQEQSKTYRQRKLDGDAEVVA